MGGPGFVAHTPQPKPLASDPFMILNFLQDDMNILQLKKFEDLWVYGIQTTNYLRIIFQERKIS